MRRLLAAHPTGCNLCLGTSHFGISGLQELVEAEEFAAQGAGVGGPLGFAGIEREGGADGRELGVEIIEVVEDERFTNHGQLGRAEFVLAVMADQKMLDYGLEIRRETDGVHG